MDFIVDPPVPDRFNLKDLNVIRCPDCRASNMIRATQNDRFICPKCNLVIPETQLLEEVTLVPDSASGISINEKAYFNQTRQNTKGPIVSKYPAGFLIDSDDDFSTVKQFTVKGIEQQRLDEAGGVKVKRAGKYTNSIIGEQTFGAIKRLFSQHASDIEITLD